MKKLLRFFAVILLAMAFLLGIFGNGPMLAVISGLFIVLLFIPDIVNAIQLRAEIKKIEDLSTK